MCINSRRVQEEIGFVLQKLLHMMILIEVIVNQSDRECIGI